MTIQIDDATTEALVRELAKRRGVTILQAVAQTMVLDAKEAAKGHPTSTNKVANED